VNISGQGGTAGENDTFSGIETIQGGSANDDLLLEGPSINGGDTVPHFGNYVLSGNGGNDSLHADAGTFVDDAHIHVSMFGASGNDTFEDNPALIRSFEFGGAGNDTFNAFEEEDAHLPEPRIVDAGPGIDTEVIGTPDVNAVNMALNLENVKVLEGGNGLVIKGNSLSNKIDCSGQSLLFGVEVLGGKGNDTITGTANADKLSGDDGNDIIHGGDGKDVITGGVGNDQLFGDGGNDTIFANDGLKDSISGGLGVDKAKRDAGLDVVSSVEVFL
jgi:Ca2+-binding RTX toxin-like protein